jgi:hypothetical protein
LVIDVIEKGTIARSFLKQMGISNFFDGSLTKVANNRPGEIWTQGSTMATARCAGLLVRCVLQARQRANGDEGRQVLDEGAD